MVRIGYVPEIIAVKERLEELKSDNLIKDWELPYENLLTRLTAAIFFVEPEEGKDMKKVWDKLGEFPDLRYRENEERKLSEMKWRVEFNIDDGSV